MAAGADKPSTGPWARAYWVYASPPVDVSDNNGTDHNRRL